MSKHTYHHTATSVTGITLIEVMVGLAILGILISLTISSNQSSVRKAQAKIGSALINDMLLRQQSFYLKKNRYTNQLTELGFNIADTETSITSNPPYYQATLSTCDGKTPQECIIITARPTAAAAPKSFTYSASTQDRNIKTHKSSPPS